MCKEMLAELDCSGMKMKRLMTTMETRLNTHLNALERQVNIMGHRQAQFSNDAMADDASRHLGQLQCIRNIESQLQLNHADNSALLAPVQTRNAALNTPVRTPAGNSPPVSGPTRPPVFPLAAPNNSSPPSGAPVPSPGFTFPRLTANNEHPGSRNFRNDSRP